MALMRPQAALSRRSGESGVEMPESDSTPRPVFALVVGITAVALAECLTFLGRESFWLDEAYSAFLAGLPPMEFWEVLTASQANSSLYYVLLRGWVVLGTGEATVRLLSVLPAVAAVPISFALGRRLFGWRVGVAAAALLAVNAFAIQYAQEARAYSLVLFLVLLSTYLFVRAVQEGGRWTWAAYVLVTALSGYAHFFAWFVVLAQLGSLAFLDRRPATRTLLAAYGSIAVLSLPLLAFVLTTSGNQIGWIPSLSVSGIAGALGQLAGGRTFVGAAVLVAILVACVLFTLMALVQRWRRKGRSADTWRLVLVLGWLLIPIAGALAISLVKPIWVDKYLIVALPGLALTAAFGLSTRKPTLARAGLLILLVASVSQVLVLHLNEDKDDWRAATEFVLTRSEPGDGIAFYRPFGRFPFGYYADHRDESGEGQTPTAVSATFDRARGLRTPGPRAIPLALIGEAAQPFERVWVVLNPVLTSARDGVAEVLGPEYARARTAAFRDVVVDLYVRSSLPAQP
jgi:mannosyltransferase